MRTIFAFILLLALGGHNADYLRPAPQTIEVAKDVHLFMSAPYGDVGLDGNSVAITGDLLVNPIAFALSSYPTGVAAHASRSNRWLAPRVAGTEGASHLSSG